MESARQTHRLYNNGGKQSLRSCLGPVRAKGCRAHQKKLHWLPFGRWFSDPGNALYSRGDWDWESCVPIGEVMQLTEVAPEICGKKTFPSTRVMALIRRQQKVYENAPTCTPQQRS